ncbi:Peroxisomal membrane protein pex16, partial [Physocladia obscura]
MEAIEAYRQFVVKHAPIVGSIERLVESATYVLPGRFAHAEVVAEGLHAATSLLGEWHDHVLSEHYGLALNGATDGSGDADADGNSRFNRYTRALLAETSSESTVAATSAPKYTDSNNYSAFVVFTLTLAAHSSVFLEMLAADAFGDSARWKLVGAVETARFAARAWLLAASQSRMLLHSQRPERRNFDNYAVASSPTGPNTTTISTAPTPPTPTPRHRPSLSTISAASPTPGLSEAHVLAFLSKKAASVADAFRPIDLVPPAKGVAIAAEWIHISRPLLYCT